MMPISLPDTIQNKHDIQKIKLPGGHSYLNWDEVIITRWEPRYENRFVQLAWDLDKREVTLTDAQPADEAEITEALAAIGQPEPKLMAGRVISDRVDDLEGRDIRSLNSPELKLLLTAVLWNLKALNHDGTLRHPRHWVKNREP